MPNMNQAPDRTTVIAEEIARIKADAVVRRVAEMNEHARNALIRKLRAAYKRYPDTRFYFIHRIPYVYIPLLRKMAMPTGDRFQQCAKRTELNWDRLLEELVTICEVFLPKATTANPA